MLNVCSPADFAAGPTPDVVRRAKQEIKRILEESTEKAMRREAPSAGGRYSVV
jgi:ATP-dependent RNA helicase DDX46/PRP5